MPLLINSLLLPAAAIASPANGHLVPRALGIVVPLRPSDSRADEIAIIAHELRNSLSVVRNAARLLRL